MGKLSRIQGNTRGGMSIEERRVRAIALATDRWFSRFTDAELAEIFAERERATRPAQRSESR